MSMSPQVSFEMSRITLKACFISENHETLLFVTSTTQSDFICYTGKKSLDIPQEKVISDSNDLSLS